MAWEKVVKWAILIISFTEEIVSAWYMTGKNLLSILFHNPAQLLIPFNTEYPKE